MLTPPAIPRRMPEQPLGYYIIYYMRKSVNSEICNFYNFAHGGGIKWPPPCSARKILLKRVPVVGLSRTHFTLKHKICVYVGL